SPNTSTTDDDVLTGVTCTSASDCWAVGYYDYYNNGTVAKTLIEQWNGTSWSIVTSPNTSATDSDFLTGGVTCTSASDCWAVGYYEYYNNGSTVAKTLIEQWNGISWSIVTSPNKNPQIGQNILDGVTCASASDCWAVGYYANGGSVTLVEQWNGTAWSIVASPNVAGGGTQNVLNGVTCASASDCWAVGFYQRPTTSPQP